MTIFLDIMVTLVVLLILVTDIEFLAFLVPYVGIMAWVIAGTLLIKYASYLVPRIRMSLQPDIDERTGKPIPTKRGYIIAYPLCDLVRMLFLAGLIAAIYTGFLANNETFGFFIDSMICLVLIVGAYVVDFFCKESESLLFQIILTAVFCAALLIFTKGAIFGGISAVFSYL